MPTAIRVVDQFIELSDTPASFSGQGSKFVAVNSGATALEFVASPATAPGGSTTQVQYNNAGAFGGAAGFVYQAAASPNVSITAQNAAYTPLLVKGAASQSVNIQEWQNSAGTVVAGVDERGIIFSDGGGSNRNVMIGNDAGNGTLSTGIDNFGLGYQTLDALTSGTKNVGIGGRALSTLITGTENIGIGADALYNATGNNNVAIGSDAGRSMSSGSGNIFIGKSAGYRQFTSSNMFIIDNQLRADIATEATNAILYGVMAAAPANQDLTVNANLFLSQVKSGATQVAAGAAANEVWKTASHATLPDNVLMIGV